MSSVSRAGPLILKVRSPAFVFETTTVVMSGESARSLVESWYVVLFAVLTAVAAGAQAPPAAKATTAKKMVETPMTRESFTRAHGSYR
jgi:hypothetical protein